MIISKQIDMFEGRERGTREEATPEHPVVYEEKHLARNVPERFSVVCNRIRLKEIEPMRRRQIAGKKLVRTYSAMLIKLSDQEVDDDEITAIEHEIDEVMVRFLALQKTVDMTVPAKAVFSSLSGLERSLKQIILKLDDPDRDAVVAETTDVQHGNVVTNASDILALTNLAAKVTATRDFLVDTHQEIRELTRFFDYKSGLVRSGRPSKYAMVFAVHALADIFERKNTKGLEAQVNEFADGGRMGETGHRGHARRYTGEFLDFIINFYQGVVPEQMDHGLEGFSDQVRKYARRRLQDPNVFKLLYEDDASHVQVLEFMKRADALK